MSGVCSLLSRFRIFASLPFLMLFAIALAFYSGEFLPMYYKQIFYTVSITIKECVLFILPLVIFTLLFSSMTLLAQQQGVLKIILILVPMICLSNFTTTWVAYLFGKLFISGQFNVLPSEVRDELLPLIHVGLPTLIRNEVALFAGIIVGIISGTVLKQKSKAASELANKFVLFVLRKVIVPVMPIFIFGFLVKLQHDKILSMLIEQYSYLFLVILTAQIIYVSLLILLGQGFNFINSLSVCKRILPAVVTGFSTMSSASSLPLIFVAAEKNTKSPMLSRLVISTSVNIHLIGDCLAIPITAFALLQNFGMDFPDLTTFLLFSSYFVVAKFAVAAVPGGGILVMLPILEQYLGFTNGMLSMITAIYILFDPVVTAINVAGNNAFVILFDNFHEMFMGKKKGAG